MIQVIIIDGDLLRVQKTCMGFLSQCKKPLQGAGQAGGQLTTGRDY